MRTSLIVFAFAMVLGGCLAAHAEAPPAPRVVVNPPPVPPPPTAASATQGSGMTVSGQNDGDPNNRVKTVQIGNMSVTGQDAQTDASGQMAIVTHAETDPPPANNPPANGNNPGPAPAAPAAPQIPKPEMPEVVPIPKLDTKAFDDAAPWLGLKDDQRASIAALKKRLADDADRLGKAQTAARAKYTDSITPEKWNLAAQEVTKVAKEILNFQPEQRFTQTLVLILDKDQWALYQEKLNGKKK